MWKERCDNLREQNRNMTHLLLDKDTLISKYLAEVERLRSVKTLEPWLNSTSASYPTWGEDDVAEETTLP
jgi:hypothetical protein